MASPTRRALRVIVHKTVQKQTVTATAQAVAANKLVQKAAPVTLPVQKEIVSNHVPKAQLVTSRALAVVAHKLATLSPQAVNLAALEPVPKHATTSVHVSPVLVPDLSLFV